MAKDKSKDSILITVKGGGKPTYESFCLNCGKMSKKLLCEKCITGDVLNRIYPELRNYKPDSCKNQYIRKYASIHNQTNAVREIIPDVLSLFTPQESEYYYCKYYKLCGNKKYEELASEYLNSHSIAERKCQEILYDLIEYYLYRDYDKPRLWADRIKGRNDLCGELYLIAARYFGMVAEYDDADEMINRGLLLCKKNTSSRYLYYDRSTLRSKLEQQRSENQFYRNVKPYWPTTEDRREMIASIYDRKGIDYSSVYKTTNNKRRVPESSFAPIKECMDERPTNYCAFWCNEAYTFSNVRCIYQIGAVKVINNTIVDSFESLVYPWDAKENGKEKAAQEIGVPVKSILSAEHVEVVIPRFFDFVEDYTLLSTGALGKQSNLLSRAVRYAGLDKIKNDFFDVLDYAADISDDFDMKNNNREYLLSFFSISEGKTALQKARVNKELYDALMDYGDNNDG